MRVTSVKPPQPAVPSSWKFATSRKNIIYHRPGALAGIADIIESKLLFISPQCCNTPLVNKRTSMRLFLFLSIIISLSGIEPRFNHPDSLIQDHVSAIDGSYSDSVLDFESQSGIPIQVWRYYSNRDESPCKNFGQWRFNSYCYLHVDKDSSTSSYEVDGNTHNAIIVSTTDKKGRLIELRGWNSPESYTIKLAKKIKGISNCYENIGGQTNLANIALNWDANSELFTLTSGDGSEKVYTRSQSAYRLIKERLPSSMYLYYEYEDDRLVKIWGTPIEDGPEKVSISFEYGNNTVFLKSSNQWVKYSFKDSHLVKVENSRGYQEVYEYNRVLTKRSLPNGLSEAIAYDADNRVVQLKRVGLSSSLDEQSTSFQYEAGKTSAHSKITQIFHFNTSLLLTKKEEILDKPYRSIEYLWGTRGKNGFLLSQTLHDENFCRGAYTLEYDKFGNVTKHTLFGNLTGREKIIELSKGVPSNDVDKVSKTYKYSQDGRNLLLLEVDNKGGRVEYEYFDGNLPQSVIVFAGLNDQKSRTIYRYKDKLLKSISIDNDPAWGDDISEQVKWEFDYSTAPGSWGVPIKVRHFELNASLKLSLVKTHSIKLEDGQITRQWITDADGAILKDVYFAYDKFGNLTNERESVRSSSLSYDRLGRVKSVEIDGVAQSFEYDLQGNVTKETTGPLSRTFRYDGENLIELTDEWGNTTFLGYDPINRLTNIRFPKVKTLASSASPTIHIEYDIFNGITKVSDLEGQIVQKNTLRAQPYIRNNSGLQELFKYDAEGSLHRYQSPDGWFRVFEYDYQSRLTGVGRYVSKDGKLDECEHFQSSSSLLNAFEASHPNGLATKSITEGRKTSLRLTRPKHTLLESTHNSLGWLKQRTYFTNQPIYQLFSRDELGRLTSVEVKNAYFTNQPIYQLFSRGSYSHKLITRIGRVQIFSRPATMKLEPMMS